MKMRRRTASACLLTGASGLLAACSAPKTPLPEGMVPVISSQNGMDVSPDAPQVALPQATALADWPQPLVNAAHAPGNVAAPLNFARRWSASAGVAGGYRQPLSASPVIAGGVVYAMDANANVHACSLQDGTQAWHVDTRPKHASEQNLGGGIAFDSGKLYASTGYGELLALDAATGKILWRQKLDYPARSAPLIANGLVAVVTQDDLLLTFDTGSGTPGWRFVGVPGQPSMTAVSVAGAPAFADGIIVAGFSSGTLAAVDANSGTPVWEQSLAASFGQAGGVDFSDIVASPVIAGGVVYAINLGDTFMAVDLHSGAKVWTHNAAGMQAPALAGGFVFVLDNDQMLYAVHADDGLVSWSLQMPQYLKPKTKSAPLAWIGPVLMNGALVLVNSNGRGALVDPVAGKITQDFKLQAPADMPPIAAGGAMVQYTRDAQLTVYG